MHHGFLIHSSADGHLGCFHVRAIINSAAMNIGVHVSLSDLVSSVCMPRSGIILDRSRQTKTWRPNLLPVYTDKALLGHSPVCLFTVAAFTWPWPSWLVVTDMVWLPEPLAFCSLPGFFGKKFTDFCSRQSACLQSCSPFLLCCIVTFHSDLHTKMSTYPPG